MFSAEEIEIQYGTPDLVPSFRRTLDRVAREKVYIEITKAFPLKQVREFQVGLMRKKAPIFYAVHKGEVIGWIDISWSDNPRMKHRGRLGMGLLPEYRGNGIGGKLMDAALKQARKCKLEKVELQVYTSNKRAIALYKKMGFKVEGQIQRYRKVGNRYFDCLCMGKFLR
jgi:ribosomal protein S18 acetylase RimI-like enzyme